MPFTLAFTKLAKSDQTKQLQRIQEILDVLVPVPNTPWIVNEQPLSVIKFTPTSHVFLKNTSPIKKIEILFSPYIIQNSDALELKNIKMIFTVEDEHKVKSRQAYHFNFLDDKSTDSASINIKTFNLFWEFLGLIHTTYGQAPPEIQQESTFARASDTYVVPWQQIAWSEYKTKAADMNEFNFSQAAVPSDQIVYTKMHQSLSQNVMSYLAGNTALQKKAAKGITPYSLGCGDGDDIIYLSRALKKQYTIVEPRGIDFSQYNISDALKKYGNQEVVFISGNVNDIAQYVKIHHHLTIAFFIGVLARQVFPGTLEALTVVQKTHRCRPDLTVICSKTHPLINKDIAKAVGFNVTVKSLDVHEGVEPITYFMQPMTEDERYAKLIKRAIARNENKSSLDLSMSANPLADLELLEKKPFDLTLIKQIDLSWAMMENGEIKKVLSNFIAHMPNLSRILCASSESWYSQLQDDIKPLNKYILYKRYDNDIWGKHELPLVMPYKAKLLHLYTELPVKVLSKPSLPSSSSGNDATLAYNKK